MLHAPNARRSSLLVAFALSTAGCVATFDPENDDQVVGSEVYATPFAVAQKGVVRVLERRAQVGEHAGGVHRAWRAEIAGGEALTPWLTTTPLVDGRGEPQLYVSGAGVVFAFDPGGPIDSRDQQTHLPKGWYRVGARGVGGERCDAISALADGGYETCTEAAATQSLRTHRGDGTVTGEVTIQKGSARSTQRAGWRVATLPDGAVALLDESLRAQGRVVERAKEPGEWIDVSADAAAARPFGLGPDRELMSTRGETLPGPWQGIGRLVDRGLVVLMLHQADGGLTLVEPAPEGLRVLMRNATFALAQSRAVPAAYADVAWGTQVSVVLAGEKTAAGDGYALFALIDGLVRGPFAAATSEATTEAMWTALQPIADARRVVLAELRAAYAAAAAASAAELQRSIDAMSARLDTVAREQIVYFDALRAGDFAAAGRAIAAMEQQLDGFFVPQGHAATESLRQRYEAGHVYFLDWELRRPDRTLARLGERAASYFFAGSGLYHRFCREAGRMVMDPALTMTRELHEQLARSSHGFSDDAKYMLRWHRDALDRREAAVRYRGLLAAGRFKDAHDMSYQLGVEGWVEHLLTQAKGRIGDGELESLLRAAIDRAPTDAMREALRNAHYEQWQDMVAAQEREQRARFARMDEEHRRAEAGAQLRRQQEWAAYKTEAAKRGFLWHGN